ncbi:hypothetical protein JAAARDRAFT_187039 [Jaapia argillacea MUCL 33604]|uniref:FAD-binding FR-type domain-containing protein n=1 Tax=Jaapia argillacea MUCL 33604 TaxID=933084 RepID=A0A067P6P0_9AGAM|nr:hypothetical protein JAAARDRAFT_187039 [Jaapia argillacea MUCL 33604]
MSGFGDAPQIPSSFQIYNSYVEDPKYQRKFTIVWASLAGLVLLLSLPAFYRAIKRGKTFEALLGVREDWKGIYLSVGTPEKDEGLDVVDIGRPETMKRTRGRQLASSLFVRIRGAMLWTIPYLELDVGQILIVVGYLTTVLVCIIRNAPLMSNPNRAGFMALAQLSPVFLLSTKSLHTLPLFSSLPSLSYEKINFLHRWAGRILFLSAAIHGSLWINNHLTFGLPILGQQKEGSGVAAFSVLCLIVLSSMRVVRRWAYQGFFYLHVAGFVAFFITICYHTPFASPWIFPPLAFYGLDLVLRMGRYRVKDALLIHVGSGMTLIDIPDCTSGWSAGQHLRLRIFLPNQHFIESHPLTVMNAPPSTSCLTPPPNSCHPTVDIGYAGLEIGKGMLLGARALGDWTEAVESHMRSELGNGGFVDEKDSDSTPMQTLDGVPIQVMIDGPYGGSSIDLGEYENVLLVAGGSGATYTIGLLDDLVGRVVRLGRRGGERTRLVEFVWCIRSFANIEWFAPILQTISRRACTVPASSFELRISIYVTCLCNPDAVPDIPNSKVLLDERPSVRQLVKGLVHSAPSPSVDVVEIGGVEAEVEKGMKVEVRSADAPREPDGEEVGRVAVCASGPTTLVREARNAVARLGMSGVYVGLQTEVFSM